MELARLSPVTHTEQVDDMQKPIMKQLGKQMREKFPLPDDLPAPIRKAMERLAATEKSQAMPAHSVCEN